MSMHWTYENFDPDSDLHQGDILEAADELRSLLKDVHPHFLNPKYTAFMILTQSCDMVIRNEVSSAKYINIAVVRPLDAVINDLFSSSIGSFANGVYPKEKKFNAQQLLERIFNQNEQALGLFYLHPNAEVGIGEPSVSLIRVTITLRAQHYEVLKRVRRGRLNSQFRSKLGWLVGNLYGRVGTEDWSDTPARKEELKKLTSEYLDKNPRCVWVKSGLVDEARKRGIILEEIPLRNIIGELKKYEQPPAIKKAIERVHTVVNNVCPTIQPDEIKKICNRLQNDRLFSNTIKRE